MKNSKHVMLPTGELHVLNVDARDGRSSYRCRTLHKLTGRTQESATVGRLLVSEPKEQVSPHLTEKSPSTIIVRRGEDIAVPCVAQGYPPPKYWWTKREDGSGLRKLLFPSPGDRRSLLGGTLFLRGVQPEDAGIYVCSANSTSGSVSTEVQLRVLPDVTAHIVPASLRVDSGSTAVFLCVTQAQQITWLKDGQRLMRSEQSGKGNSGGQTVHDARLVLTSVQREDQGMYQCMASIESDTVQASAELRLGASKPQLLYKFIEQTLQPGPDVSLKCVATGQPTPQVYWSLDGFPLPQSDRFVIGQYVTMTGDVISHVNISKVAVEDGGTYECAAENRVGRTRHAAPLRVYGLPVIRKMPPISAVAGETLVVTCPAAGYPIHAITWEKDGRVLPGNHRQTVSPNGTLTIENVQQKTDHGTYTCQARNRQGHSDRGSVEINVMEPPSIYPFSIESSVHLGERVGLQCLVAKGDEPLTITWLKDETEVTSLQLPSLTVRNLGAFSSALLIDRLATEHGGVYTCQASNAAATASHSVTLAVNVPPEITPFAFPELAEGARVQVACTVHRGDLPLNLTWLKNSSPIPSHIHITPFNTYSSIVTMSNVRRGDSGNYTCVARNPARATTYTAHLTISVPPEWVVEPKDTSAIAGQSVALDCQADGFPQPNITWRKGQGKSANNFGDVEVPLPNGTLYLPSVSEEDEGHYLCEANNGIGAGLSAVIFLTVNALPRFVVPLTKETVRRGHTATFLCEAAGDVPMQIAWHHNGARISPEINYRFHIKENFLESSAMSQLSIRNVSAADSGKYVCIASNPFGKDETVVQLLVQDVPDAPSDVRVEECSSRSMKVVWNEPLDGNSPILYYAVSYTDNAEEWPEPKESWDPRPWAKLTDLRPATKYYIQVVAVNQLGSSAPSSTISVITEPEVPSGPPLSLRVVPVSSTSLQVSWDPPEMQQRNGAILGYYLGVMQMGSGSEGRYNYITVKVDEVNPWLLQGLRSYTEYKITIQAFNSVGAGPSSEEVVATTLESAPDAPPQELHCSSPSPDTLKVRWSPPPAASRNGLIKGYKVIYEDVPYQEGLIASEEEPSSVEVEAEAVALVSLKKYSNYTIRVSAFTAAGMGPPSDPLLCLTSEDVPGPPAAVRAALSSPRSAIISWLPPTHPNGVLLRYNIYQREVRRSKDGNTTRHTVGPQIDYYETGPLQERSDYMWWVSAVTRIGEGPSTPVIELTPAARVPAAILSFPKHLAVAWKSDVVFHCHTVGYPQPEVHWNFNSEPVTSDSKFQVWANGTLRIQNVNQDDSGNYSCHCENVHSSETVVHRLTVLVPPSPPSLDILSVTANNMTLSWSKPHDAAGLLGYILSYRMAETSLTEWHEERLPRQTSVYTVLDLECGTKYEFSAAAFNAVGRGIMGPIIEARTLGNKPEAPLPADGISSSPQSLTIHLERWLDGDCPISHFLLERTAGDQGWITVTDHAPPGASYTISGLDPATYYQLRITAYNKRGFTITEFRVSTLTSKGGVNIGTIDITSEPGPVERPIFSDMRVSLPIAFSILALVLTLTTVTICLRRKPTSCPATELPSNSEANLTNKPDYYSDLRSKKPDMPLSNAVDVSDKISDYGEEIYPYATFQVQKSLSQMNPVSSQRGFQTFVYQGSGLLEVDSYAVRQAEDDYSHVRPSLRSDTEEYDSLGSDSDSRTDEKATNFHPAYHHSNIRHSRLVSVLESSTSTEPSPMPDRRIQPKKGRFK
ncbi:cell adhesion molecule Dscam1 [Anabrus simplex]|uniref:cell adhesion molecule Dscam1 n=1 Tax=Anabrus simplex TaxID=316456 RepID=UPI0035A3D558